MDLLYTLLGIFIAAVTILVLAACGIVRKYMPPPDRAPRKSPSPEQPSAELSASDGGTAAAGSSLPSPAAEQRCTKRAVSLSGKKARQNLKDYVVLDFETTGLSPWEDEIIEVGMVRYVDGQEDAVYETYVNPLEPIPPRITKLTGISDEDVADAPTMKTVIHDIWEFIGDLPVVAHNAPFDVGFLSANYECRQIYRHIRYIDTLALARKAFPELPNHKLETLIRALGLAEAQTHRALDDVYCTQKLLMRCIDRLDQPKAAAAEPVQVPPLPTASEVDRDRDGYEANQAAMAYEAAGDLEQAIDYYERSVAKRFDGSYPYERLAILYRKRKQYSEEIRICDTAVEVLTGRPWTEKKIANFLHRKTVAQQKLAAASPQPPVSDLDTSGKEIP